MDRKHAGRCEQRQCVVILNIDIFRSANVLMTRHGEDAPIHAAMRAGAVVPHCKICGN